VPQPPKFEPARRNARSGPVKLPAEGRKGDPPPWPIPGRATVAEMRTWADLWTTPQAVAWEQLGIGTVREVARYARLSAACEKRNAPASLHAQATALADRLGLTPKSMRLLLWEIVTPDIGGAEQAPTTVRGRIKAV